MTDDEILLSLIGNPNEMLTVNMANVSGVTRPRTNPLKRNGGMVYTVHPSPKAMENPNNPNKSNYDVNEI